MKSKADKLAELRMAIAAMECVPEEKKQTAEQYEKSEDAFSRIVRLSSFRDRTRAEVRTRLSDEGFEVGEIEEALNRAASCGLVDDTRFADSRIRSLVRKGKGLTCIENDLMSFGIAISDVPGWPHDYLEQDGRGEYGRALDVLRRKPTRSKDAFRGAYQKLLRYGYSPDVSFRAAKHWVSEQGQ